MYNKKQAIVGLAVLLLMVGTNLPGEAASEPQTIKKVDTKAPITVEADKLSFSDTTGDIFAQGKVSLVQNDNQVLSELLEGNTKTTRIWVNGQATLLQPGKKLVGTKLDYNYTKQTGSMEKMTGEIENTSMKDDEAKVLTSYIKGDYIHVQPDEMILSNGWITTCSLQDPDYHVTADKIEMWPGEKLIAYNARFYLGNIRILTLAKYEKDLRPGIVSESDFPRINYNNSDGFMISQRLSHPITDSLAAYAKLTYYTKQGFQPVYGLVEQQKAYTLRLEQGHWVNGDNEWVQKDHELSFALTPYRLGESSVTADFSASTGKWTEGAISSTKNDYALYFRNDPIRLGSKYKLNLGTGYENAYYSYNQSNNEIWKVNVKVSGKPSDRLDVWTGYNYNHQTAPSPLTYDTIDVPREIITGFKYKLDEKNDLTVNTSYDVDKSSLRDLDYTLSHSLHCWQADLTYRAKRSEVNIKLSNLAW